MTKRISSIHISGDIDGIPTMAISGYNKNGLKQQKKVRSFRPYFYIDSEDKPPETANLESAEDGFVSWRGRPVTKLNCHSIRDVSELRDRYKYSYECFDDETKLLTLNGWKNRREINLGDSVLTFNAYQNKTEFQPVLYKFERYVEEINMLHLETRNLDQLITPNHKIIFKTYKGNDSDWKICFAKNFQYSNTKIPLSFPIDRGIDFPISDNLIKLHAWIITEGSKNHYAFNISQSETTHPEFCKQLDNICEYFGIKTANRHGVHYRRPSKLLNWYIPAAFSREFIRLEGNHKKIPQWMLNKLSYRQLKILFNELIKGDGNIKSENSYSLGAIGQDAKESYLSLGTLLGYSSVIGKYRSVFFQRYNNYSLVGSSKLRQGSKDLWKKYTGFIWCVTVPNSYLVIMRNGKVSITGNSDIPFINRYLIDNDLRISDIRNIWYFDIEVREEEGSLDTENSPQPVTVIGVYDSLEDRYIILYTDLAEGEPFDLYDNISFVKFKSEEDMFKDFLNRLKLRHVDALIGWNSASYDLPYLFNRFNNTYHMQKTRRGDIQIPGYNLFDLMNLYRLYSESGGRSSLNIVSQLILKRKKPITRNILLHNFYDLYLTKEIDKKLQLSSLAIEFLNLSPITPEQVGYRSSIIDNYILNKYHNKIIFPRAKTAEYIEKTGAYVRDPIPGLYTEGVSVLDLKSLYPNIVRTYNMSPECVQKNGEIELINGIRVTNKRGIIPEVLDELIELRYELKRERQQSGEHSFLAKAHVRDRSYKFLINSITGLFKFSKSRYHNAEIYGAMTMTERAIIKSIIQFLLDKKIQVLFSDTDSVGIASSSINVKDEINEFIQNKFGKDFEIESDKEFKKLYLYNKKKNYFGIDSDGELQITGTVAKRTSCPMFCKSVFEEAALNFLNEKPIDLADYKEQLYNQDLENVVEFMNLKTKNISPSSYHLKAVNKSRDLFGWNVSLGKIALIPLKRIGYVALDAEQLSSVELENINYEAIYRKWIFNPVKEFYKPTNKTWSDYI